VRAWLVVRRMGRLGLSLWGSSGGVRVAGEATFDAAFG